jgi:phosphoribosylanthranilate isomerase
MILKVCGITNQDDAAAAVDGGATAIGFNFYMPSPRFIAAEVAANIVTPPDVRRVGVFVNEPPARIEEIARVARLDVVQLHGDERTAGFRVPAWKAVRVGAGFRFDSYEGFPAEALLLDGPAAQLYGGAGHTFEWKVAASSAWRIIIAGGLDGSNVARAIELARPWGVDACSKIESTPGKKDHKKMLEYLQAARVALGA